MWFLGGILGAAFVGATVLAAIEPDIWALGALTGGIAFALLFRKFKVTPPDQPDRLFRLERQLSQVVDELRQVQQRLAALEQGDAASEQPVAAPGGAEPVAREAAVAMTEPMQPAMAPIQASEAEAPFMPPQAAPQPAPRLPPTTPPEWSSRVVDWLLGGNLMARIGIVILFFGVAFLLKYAYETFHLPIELRLIGVALSAGALLVLGWRLREKRAGYALALQGGGVGLLYLTIYAAFRLYDLIPALPAFALLFCVAALSASLAVRQDSRVLAVLGAAGGFLAPILASTGQGSHVMLFGYYAVLNVGILAIAWFKAWRALNLTGFVFTFGIAGIWLVSTYRPEQFASTEPFLALFFLMYVAIVVLFARHEGDRNQRTLDGALLFGAPLLGFSMQLKLVEAFEYGAAWSAVGLGAFYLLLSRMPAQRNNAGLLPQAFLALGLVFITLSIPFAFDDRLTSAAWALEGAGVLWVGLRQEKPLAWWFGAALQLLAGFFFLREFEPSAMATHASQLPLLNSEFLGALLLAVSGLFCAWMLNGMTSAPTQRETASRDWAGLLLFAWGLIWWAIAGLNEIDRHVAANYRLHAALLFATASSLGFDWLARRLDWPPASYPALALLPLLGLAALGELESTATPPFAHLGWIAWPCAFAAHLYLLRQQRDEPDAELQGWHQAGFWLFAGLAAWEVAWQIDHQVAGRGVWPLLAWALVPAVLLAMAPLAAVRRRWPVAAWPDVYTGRGAMPLAAALAFWFLWATLTSDADAWPLPYLPLLNPLDLAQAGVLFALISWFANARRRDMQPMSHLPIPQAWALLGVAGFLWANAVLLRTLHHFAGIEFAVDVLLDSDLVQASLSLFWTLIALLAMVLATRRGWRPLWLAGAGLMFAVVVKLLLVDLSNVATIERIVSFVGVGLLMLVVGYFAPAPPKSGDTAERR